VRRLIVRVAATFVGLAAVLFGPSGPVQASAATPVPIVVISDSYTSGSAEGGIGPHSWPVLARQLLSQRGLEVDADVEAEGGAGYGHPGSDGNVFHTLAARSVDQSDALVVFFGSHNDQTVDPLVFPALVAGTLLLTRFAAPTAKFLVIGPPWTATGPSPATLRIRDTLRDQAQFVGAVFVDTLAEGWFVDRPDLLGADGIHPTDAGHAYLAEKIAPLIYDQLAAPEPMS